VPRAQKPASKSKSKSKSKAKKSAKPRAKPAKPVPAASSPVETEVAALLASYAAGDIDNAWDVLPRMMELDELLPRSSKLWEAYNKMSTAIAEIARKSEMGED
jgi:hypothetical protein